MPLTNYISSKDGVTLLYDDRDPVMIISSAENYAAVMDAVKSNRFDDPCLYPSKGDLVKKASEKSQSKFKVEHGYVFIDGERLPDILSEKLIEFAENGISTKPLENFWKNLRMNPSKNSQEDLFTFLEKGTYPITSDGCFVAHKRVNKDFKDIYTRTIDNSPGTVVQVPRNLVDPDRHNTCSDGLHVANHEYAAHHYGTGGITTEDKMVLVKINPRDVVAVPTDYNNQKMRVCEYLVLEEVDFTFTNGSNIWRDAEEDKIPDWNVVENDDHQWDDEDDYDDYEEDSWDDSYDTWEDSDGHSR